MDLSTCRHCIILVIILYIGWTNWLP